MSGTYVIDIEAAKADMNCIQNAIPDLQAARAALLKVKEEGEVTQGKTGRAIVEKSSQLIRRIDRLIRSLQETKQEIHVTVKQNQELQEAIRSGIGSMMG